MIFVKEKDYKPESFKARKTYSRKEILIVKSIIQWIKAIYLVEKNAASLI